jgi:hypothetical protein
MAMGVDGGFETVLTEKCFPDCAKPLTDLIDNCGDCEKCGIVHECIFWWDNHMEVNDLKPHKIQGLVDELGWGIIFQKQFAEGVK